MGLMLCMLNLKYIIWAPIADVLEGSAPLEKDEVLVGVHLRHPVWVKSGHHRRDGLVRNQFTTNPTLLRNRDSVP